MAVALSGGRTEPLRQWHLAIVRAGRAPDPSSLDEAVPEWITAAVPGTAFSALFAAGRADFTHLPDLDAHDVWYRCRFDAPQAENAPHRLLFEGLATLAEVWLNRSPLMASDNMFLAHAADAPVRPTGNELLIRFRSVIRALEARRPRPRWRTRLVDQQQLRWIRASLLGRMPGWTPAVPAVGPWRPVSLESGADLSWETCDVRAALRDDAGVVCLRGRIHAGAHFVRPAVLSATLRLGDAEAALDVTVADDGSWTVEGEVVLQQPALWWPHTHGSPALHDVFVTVTADGAALRFALGRTGFRRVALDTADDGFSFSVNGVPVFCRGACWTTTDILALAGTAEALRDTLLLARGAGMNMLRVGGTMFYESDDFYALCDEFGILLWHDWMFASMDYPADDAAFVAGVAEEARQFLCRTRLSPCLALLCGNSEVEQQAAMVGAEPALWRSPLFADLLPDIGRTLRPDVPYWPSSPAGGVLPFQVDAGAAHYFGVGAYLQPRTDARRSSLRFASECLAFANVPEPANLELVADKATVPPHHPLWKARVPRDGGAAWDFDDVRDHYLRELFGTDPMPLRLADPERYLALSRVASGEVMAGAFAEWRRQGSTCSGALVWFLRDLWPGAGWGVVDSAGEPKAAWHYLRRALAPVAVFLLDEGVNGLSLHVVNDGAAPVEAELSLTLWRQGGTVVAEGRRQLRVPGRGGLHLRGDALLGRFTDSSYTYRFGPPGHDLAHAVLRNAAGDAVLGADFFFPLGHAFAVQDSVGLEAEARYRSDGSCDIAVRTQRFAQAVRIEAPGWRPDTNYFHLAPGGECAIRLTPAGRPAPLRATLEALNSAERIRVRPSPTGAAP